MSVLTNPWKLHLLFLQEAYPKKFHILNFLFAYFSGIAQLTSPFAVPQEIGAHV